MASYRIEPIDGMKKLRERIFTSLVLVLLFTSVLQGFFHWYYLERMSLDDTVWQDRPIPAFFQEAIQDLPDYNVILMKLDGVISSDPESSASFFASQLERSALIDQSDAMILILNSPGGTTGVTKKIYDQIRSLAKKRQIICIIDEIAASGGYYIASACDFIFAQQTSIVGSIGVISVGFKVHRMLKKLGIEASVIKAGEFKDASFPFRPLTKEEKIMMQELIDESYQLFLTDVSKGRKVDKDKVLTWAEGRVFLGNKALEMGMIDANWRHERGKRQIGKKMGCTAHSLSFDRTRSQSF